MLPYPIPPDLFDPFINSMVVTHQEQPLEATQKAIMMLYFCFLTVILRRMSDFEQPLVLRLLWGGSDIRHNFSLQENETGDIVVSDMPLDSFYVIKLCMGELDL